MFVAPDPKRPGLKARSKALAKVHEQRSEQQKAIANAQALARVAKAGK